MSRPREEFAKLVEEAKQRSQLKKAKADQEDISPQAFSSVNPEEERPFDQSNLAGEFAQRNLGRAFEQVRPNSRIQVERTVNLKESKPPLFWVNEFLNKKTKEKDLNFSINPLVGGKGFEVFGGVAVRRILEDLCKISDGGLELGETYNGNRGDLSSNKLILNRECSEELGEKIEKALGQKPKANFR